MEIEGVEFIQARNYTAVAAPARAIDLIVVHTMEHPEKPGTARNVALWFAGASAPEASAHFCIDDAEVIQCVRLQDVAWAAPGANHDGVHLEHSGYAAQTPIDWDDDYSRSVLFNSAKVAAELCKRFDVPILRVDPTPGARGFCGHVDVTNWRNAGKGHQDPGTSFPWPQYLGLVAAMLHPTDPAPDLEQA